MNPERTSDGAIDEHANTKPSLLIEIQLNDAPSRLREEEMEELVEKSLRTGFTCLSVGQVIDLRTLNCAAFVNTLAIVGQSHSTTFPDETVYLVDEHQFQFFTYKLHTDDPSEEHAYEGAESEISHSRVSQLPHKRLEGCWERLVFEDSVAEDALRALIRSQQLGYYHLSQPWISNVLFYGPSGTGKTTLTLGIAQKLAIRLKHLYYNVYHVEVQSHALLSSLFGQSAKEVGKFFTSIEALASDNSQLVIITFDEVESLVSSRQRASDKNECEDGVRSTNEFLRGLDRLRPLSNVVFLATSNMRDRMDEAFLDRFSLQRFIGRPALSATFEILRSRINALIQRGLVACDNAISSKGHTDMSQTSISGYSSGDDHVPCSTSINTNSFLLPRPYSAAAAMHPNAENVVELSRIARFGETLSARKLEGVIDVAVCMYTTGNTCKLSQVFAALEKVLRQECSGVDREVVQSEPVEPSHMEPTEEEGLEEFDAEEEYRQWQESLGI